MKTFKYFLGGIALLILCGGCYVWGRSSADQEWSKHLFDALTLQRLLWVRTDLTNLSLLREGKVEEAIQGMEVVIESGVKTLDVDRAKAAPLSGPDLERTKQALTQYNAKFTATQLDPKRNAQVGNIFR